MAEKQLMVVVGAKTESFEKAMDNMAKKMKTVGKDLEKIGKDLSKKLTAPLVAMGGLSVKAAIDFESAFAGVRKTVDATEEEFASLEDGIRSMAKEIPATATEIAGVAEAAGQLGIAKEHILGFSRTMIDLGQTTNMTSEEAATALARLANITQMPQSEFDKLGSTVVALGNNLATTEAEIVEMGLRLAGAGSQIGMTEAQILGFSGALSSVGIAAEAGGSAFSKLMIDMQLATETGGERLEQLAGVAGMSASQFQRAFRDDAAGALIAFIDGLQTAEQRGMSAIKVLNDIGITEVRMRDALLRAAGAGELFAEAIELGSRAWEENTALTNEAAQRYETTASKLAMLKNQVTEVAIQFGDLLVPVIMKVTEKIQGFLSRLEEMNPTTKTVILVIGGLLAAIGPVVLAVAKLSTALSVVIPIIKTIGVAIAGLATGPAAPFVLVGVVATGLVGLFLRFKDDIVAVLFNLIDSVMGGLEAFGDAFVGVFRWIRDNTVGIFERMWDSIKQVINWIIGGVNKMIGALNNIKIDIPSWVPGLGGSTFGFNMAEIPLLADGGFIRQPGVAIVGEAGPELVHLPQGAKVEPLPAGPTERMRQPIQLVNNFYTNKDLDEKEVDRRMELSLRRLELEFARRF